MAFDDEKTISSVPATSPATDATKFGADEYAETEFPEGGLRAWSVVFGAWLLQFCTLGYANGYGAYNDFYVRKYLNQNYTTSQIGWIGSVQLFLFLSLGLVAGRANDIGYYHHLMIGGCILFMFCLFMLSWSQAEQFYQVFLTQGFGVGIGTGVTYVPGCAIVSHYFHRRRALALGISASGAAIGGAIHPIMLNHFFHGNIGFHNGVRISAGLLGFLLLVSYLLLKPRLPPKPSQDGNLWQDVKMVMRDPPYALTTIGIPLVIAGVFYPILFLQTLAIERGIDPNIAFYTLVILNFASAIGRVLATLIVAKFGVYNFMVPCVVICGGLTSSALALRTVTGTVIFAVFYGLFAGAYLGLLPTMLASLANENSEIGARLGIGFGFAGFGGLAGELYCRLRHSGQTAHRFAFLTGPPIIGALLSKDFLWWRPTVFSIVCIYTGALCFSTSRFIIAIRKGTWRV